MLRMIAAGSGKALDTTAVGWNVQVDRCFWCAGFEQVFRVCCCGYWSERAPNRERELAGYVGRPMTWRDNCVTECWKCVVKKRWRSCHDMELSELMEDGESEERGVELGNGGEKPQG